jgi:hypothetical protein
MNDHLLYADAVMQVVVIAVDNQFMRVVLFLILQVHKELLIWREVQGVEVVLAPGEDQEIIGIGQWNAQRNVVSEVCVG